MSSLHPNVATLHQLYADLRRIDDHAHEDMVLHTAQRALGPEAGRIVGKTAVSAKIHELIRQTGDTLRMQVDSIVANDYFGAVLGSIRTERDEHDIAMPFCGLWRFRDGRVLEHWENAYDIAGLDAFILGEGVERSAWVQPLRKMTTRK